MLHHKPVHCLHRGCQYLPGQAEKDQSKEDDAAHAVKLLVPAGVSKIKDLGDDVEAVKRRDREQVEDHQHDVDSDGLDQNVQNDGAGGFSGSGQAGGKHGKNAFGNKGKQDHEDRVHDDAGKGDEQAVASRIFIGVDADHDRFAPSEAAEDQADQTHRIDVGKRVNGYSALASRERIAQAVRHKGVAEFVKAEA